MASCWDHARVQIPPSRAEAVPRGPREREAGTIPLWRWLRPHGRHRSTPRCPGSATHRPPAVTAVADTGTVRPRWSTTPVTANHVNLLSRGQKMSRCHEGHTCAPGWRGGKYQGLSPWGGLSGCAPPWKSPCRVWGRRCHGRTFPPASGRNGSAVSSGHAGDGRGARGPPLRRHALQVRPRPSAWRISPVFPAPGRAWRGLAFLSRLTVSAVCWGRLGH